MNQDDRAWFLRGMRDGMPIALGYLAVAFTLGIAARNAGLTAFQATLASLLNNASAGEYAGFTVIREQLSYVEMGVMIFITNMRYLLMSCALSQKLAASVSMPERLLVGFGVTDEIFGVSVAVPGYLNPRYSYGLMSVAIPGWALGTCLGVVMGNVLPASVVSALSVGLYGMFIAVIVPPARESRVLAGLIVLSMAASLLFAKVPPFSGLSTGMRVIILTVALSAAAAILFPVKEEDDAA